MNTPPVLRVMFDEAWRFLGTKCKWMLSSYLGLADEINRSEPA